MDTWYNAAVRKIHFDMHTPASVEDVGRHFRPRRFAESLADTGYEAVCFFAKCTYGWSYYPTRIGRPHPHCSRDLFGEACEALHDTGLRVIAYYALEVLPPPLVPDHGDLLKRQADNAPCILPYERACGCIFGPMLDRIILPQLREIAAAYPIDAFFLDGLPQAFWQPCHCEACRHAFGGAVPNGPGHPAWPAYREWQLRTQAEWAANVAAAVHDARPGVLLGINYLAAQPCSPIPPPPGVDYLTADASVHDSCALNTSYQLAAWTWRDIPCDVMNARMLGWWQDWTMRPLAAMLVEAAIGLSRGAVLFLGDLIAPDTVQPHPAVLSWEKQINAFVRSRESLRRNVRPFAEIAVLHDVGEGFAQGANPDAGSSRGAFLGLLECSWPLHVLYPGDLAAALSEYVALVVCSGAGLGEEHLDILQRYVNAGGGVLFLSPGPGLRRLAGMSALTGLEFTETAEEMPVAYLDVGTPYWEKRWPKRLGAAYPMLPPILVPGKPAFARRVDAEILCPLTAPGPLYQMGARPPGNATEWVGISRFALGEGRVVFCALDLGRDVLSRGNSLAQDLLHVLAGLTVGRAPMVEVDAPAPIEVNLARGEEILRIHLVHHHGGWKPGNPYLPDRIIPAHGVALRLRLPEAPVTVRQFPGNLHLPWGVDPHDGRTILTVSPVEIHCCVEVSSATA